MKIYEEYPLLLDEVFVEGYNFGDAISRKDADAPLGQLDTAVAVLKTGGVLADMVKLLGRSRQVITTYISRDPHLTELSEEVAETFLDEVEKLHKKAALEGDLSTQRFILTTLGKNRGYVTRQDMNVDAKTSVHIDSEDAKL